MDKVNYTIHFEIGLEGHLTYARIVLHNNAFEWIQYHVTPFDSLNALVSDMKANGVFGSIARKPRISSFPFANHHDPNAIILFFLHVETGLSDPGGADTPYIKTEFSDGTVIRLPYNHHQNAGPDTMHYDLFDVLENKGILTRLITDPSLSVFPFGSKLGMHSHQSNSFPGQTTHPKPASKKDNVKRQLPSHIIDIPHPECQNVCTSWDIFGVSKCKNMCEWRKV